MNLHQETRLKDALRTLRELSLELEINLLHNYGYRELLQISEARGYFENLEKARGLHKEDASSKFYSNIEFKSCKSKRLKCNRFSKTTKFEFDKQNDEFRRKQTLSYDAMVFTVFDSSSETPVLTAIIKNKESMDEINKAIKLKQKAFLKLLKESTQKGKRVLRDSISFNIEEIFNLTSVIWVQDKKEITKEEAKKLFKMNKNNKKLDK